MVNMTKTMNMKRMRKFANKLCIMNGLLCTVIVEFYHPNHLTEKTELRKHNKATRIFYINSYYVLCRRISNNL